LEAAREQYYKAQGILSISASINLFDTTNADVDTAIRASNQGALNDEGVNKVKALGNLVRFVVVQNFDVMIRTKQ
jgi:hypothetical protein